MTGYEVYNTYLAIKFHFTQDSYDYFRFNGKVKTRPSSFEVRKDRLIFEAIARKIQCDGDIIDQLVANYVEFDNPWIGDIFSQEGTNIYHEWKKRTQSLTYRFNEDVNVLVSKCGIKNILKVSKSGQYPPLLKSYMRKEICPETMSVFNLLFQFCPKWSDQIQDQIYWPTMRRKIVKYTDFVKPLVGDDRKRFARVILDTLQDS